MPRPVDSHELLDPRPVRLPTPTLQRAWQQALLGIDRATNTLVILHHVSTAQGFVWAVQISNLVTDDEAREMNAAISHAERAAFLCLAGGGHPDDTGLT
ncbi:hypothetical protein [Pseudomonas sp. LB3P38]|uniref:hypothetical protein n=1 Tax=Pseudomonas lyxosi TaxID=3398358 RepID=UPI0039EF3ABC